MENRRMIRVGQRRTRTVISKVLGDIEETLEMRRERIQLVNSIENGEDLTKNQIEKSYLQLNIAESTPKIEVVRIPQLKNKTLGIIVAGPENIQRIWQKYGDEIDELCLVLPDEDEPGYDEQRHDIDRLFQTIANSRGFLYRFYVVNLPTNLNLSQPGNQLQIGANDVEIANVNLGPQLPWLASFCPVVQDICFRKATIVEPFYSTTFEDLTRLLLEVDRFESIDQTMISRFLMDNLQLRALVIVSVNGYGTMQERNANGEYDTTTIMETDFFRTLENMPGLRSLNLRDIILDPQPALEWLSRTEILRFMFGITSYDVGQRFADHLNMNPNENFVLVGIPGRDNVVMLIRHHYNGFQIGVEAA